MKKLYLFFSLFSLSVIFIACTKEDGFEKEVKGNISTSKSAGDGIYDVLGYGYDITDEFIATNSVKKQIINIKQFVEDYPYRFDNPFIGETETRVFFGADALTFMSNIRDEANIMNSLSVFPDDFNVNNEDREKSVFSGSVKFSGNNEYDYSSKYSFARGEIIKKQRQYVIDVKPDILKNYLSRNFIEDLEKISPTEIVEKYGTHFLTNITIGGMYTANFKSAVNEETASIKKEEAIEAGLKFNFKRLGLNVENTPNQDEIEKLNNKNTEWIFNLKCIGGSTSGHTITLSPGHTEPSNTINLGEWTQSVDDTHSRLIEIDWSATYPVYELISDPQKRAEVKKATEDYIKGKAIEVLGLVPLYQYWNDKNSDHLYSTFKGPSIAEDWIYEFPVGYILGKPANNTVGLHQYWNASNWDHLYSTYEGENIENNWEYDFRIGYIYQEPVYGTIALHQYWNSIRFDHLYSIYKGESIENNWKYNHIIGYIYPLCSSDSR